MSSSEYNSCCKIRQSFAPVQQIAMPIAPARAPAPISEVGQILSAPLWSPAKGAYKAIVEKKPGRTSGPGLGKHHKASDSGAIIKKRKPRKKPVEKKEPVKKAPAKKTTEKKPEEKKPRKPRKKKKDGNSSE